MRGSKPPRSLPRSPGLVRGSLPHLPSEFLLANRDAIRQEEESITKQQTRWLLVIPKQLKKDRDQITIGPGRSVLQNLEHYCRYLQSSRDYVIDQCLAFILRKDRAFSDWLPSQGLAATSKSN